MISVYSDWVRHRVFAYRLFRRQGQAFRGW